MPNVIFKNFIFVNKEEKFLILNWRNSNRIRENCFNRSIISELEHFSWIDSLKFKKDCLYFLVYINNVQIGVVSFTNINSVENTCYGGYYIGNVNFLGYGILIEYLQLSYCFDVLKFKYNYAEILQRNKRIYNFHKFIFGAKGKDISQDRYFIYWSNDLWLSIKHNLEKKIKELYNINDFKLEIHDMILDKLLKVFSAVFKREILVDEDISMQNEKGWDSIKHIELIMAIEEEFNISFEPKDIPLMTSLKTIEEKLREMNA